MTLSDFEEYWDDASILEIENSLLQGMLACQTAESVEAAITFASYVSKIGMTAENYPVFLKLLEIDNHWVIDALVGQRDPHVLLSAIQPNTYIVKKIFAMLTKWRKGGIYTKNLSVILGVLQSAYRAPYDGYRIYPLAIADVNALAKHLNKKNGQDNPLNRTILEILDRLSTLEGDGDSAMDEIAAHAAAIRNAFFDNRKAMEEVIPPVLLTPPEHRIEIAPRGAQKSNANANTNAKGKKSKRKRKKAA